MADSDDITDPIGMRIEVRHLRERFDEWQERQDARLDKHGTQIDELRELAQKLKGAWWAVGIAAAGCAFLGSFAADLLSKGP